MLLWPDHADSTGVHTRKLREQDRETNRQRVRQTDRQTDRKKDKQSTHNDSAPHT